MYRAPGTASSPDLATLLRKAKQKEANSRKDRSKDSQQPLTPNRLQSDSNGSLRSPMLQSPGSTTPLSKGKSKAGPSLGAGISSPDWVLTSPRSLSSIKESGTKSSSVRAKTTAFFGKMLGTSSTRDRSRTVTSSSSNSSYSASQIFEPYPPPVPPLPSKDQRKPSITSDPSDIFSSPSTSRSSQKPLPVILNDQLEVDDDIVDERSLVMVSQKMNSPLPPSNNGPEFSKSDKVANNRRKRRSMSVSDVELKSAMAASSAFASIRSSGEAKRSQDSGGWDTALNGIITDLKGQLSQLDPISSSTFDLKDPSTPPRKQPIRSISENRTSSTLSGADRPHPKHAASSPPLTITTHTPAVTLQSVSGREESILDAVLSSPSEPSHPEDPVIPQRTSSLSSTVRARSGSANAAPPRVAALRYGPRSPPNSRNGLGYGHATSPSRESNRLRIQHRSTASSSEPSLIPNRDAVPYGASSQQDLSTNDLAARRLSVANSPVKEEGRDLDTRGKELATRCWNEDAEFLAKEKIAEWLGGQSVINKVALRHYMDFFDFSNLRLDHAFRRLCAKLYIKGETQQVDRILEEFGRRYWDCNPNSIFGSASVVHAVSYSLLLLNTDLHIAELNSRMSRGQFVRNTITAIQMQLQPNRISSTTDLSAHDDWSSIRGDSDTGDSGPNPHRRVKRSDSMTSWSSITREGVMATLGVHHPPSTGQLSSTSASDTPAQTPSVNTPVNESKVSIVSSSHDSRPAEPASTVVHDKNWENEMETMLKEIYNAIKSQQILQPVGTASDAHRLTTLKRGSIRGLQSILSNQSAFGNTSPYGHHDGRASPAPSFATSHEGLHGSNISFLTPTLGFASNLSHTIIRETQEDDAHSIGSDHSGATDISISDEELALLGPPWAKEGMLCRKHYWESTGKRSKSKNWMDVFVVIQKGELSMFVFGDHGAGGSGVVGGGNWLENASPVGVVQLAHSLAHALPSPGYNRQRPHCMVLTMSNGGAYFFQAGTEELVNEWVSTCNYWAARQSKEPLTGGVSNMEYGWNRVLDPVTRVRSASEDNFSVRDDDNVSVRSGRSRYSKKNFSSTLRADKSPWNDRVFINDWKPPMPPSVPSNHDEETQLDALRKHVSTLKRDLTEHNELRAPMLSLYAPRSSNAEKAMENWEERSRWILSEIVKYESYIVSLESAMTLRLKKRGEKALERALGAASPHDNNSSNNNSNTSVGKPKWKGQPDQDTIEESEEPPPTATGERMNFHRREVAEVGDSD
ncbi:hypothetical protein ABKN59_002913 [Abortiporus biennis]